MCTTSPLKERNQLDILLQDYLFPTLSHFLPTTIYSSLHSLINLSTILFFFLSIILSITFFIIRFFTKKRVIWLRNCFVSFALFSFLLGIVNFNYSHLSRMTGYAGKHNDFVYSNNCRIGCEKHYTSQDIKNISEQHTRSGFLPNYQMKVDEELIFPEFKIRNHLIRPLVTCGSSYHDKPNYFTIDGSEEKVKYDAKKLYKSNKLYYTSIPIFNDDKNTNPTFAFLNYSSKEMKYLQPIKELSHLEVILDGARKNLSRENFEDANIRYYSSIFGGKFVMELNGFAKDRVVIEFDENINNAKIILI
jgi:hypothetical protein